MEPQAVQAELIRRQGILSDAQRCGRATFFVVTHIPGGTVSSAADTFEAAAKILKETSDPAELYFYTDNCLFELVAAA